MTSHSDFRPVCELRIMSTCKNHGSNRQRMATISALDTDTFCSQNVGKL